MERLEIRAGLRLASFEDCLMHGKPIENKLIFIKNRLNGQFEGMLKLPSWNDNLPYHDKEINQNLQLENEYWQREIRIGVSSNSYYVLAENFNSMHFNFKLILDEASAFDLTYSPQFVKENAVYFVRINAVEISGPHYVPKNASASYFLTAISDKKLFVPAKEQNYEPINLSHAS